VTKKEPLKNLRFSNGSLKY